jgi:hypothetical protein
MLLSRPPGIAPLAPGVPEVPGPAGAPAAPDAPPLVVPPPVYPLDDAAVPVAPVAPPPLPPEGAAWPPLMPWQSRSRGLGTCVQPRSPEPSPEDVASAADVTNAAGSVGDATAVPDPTDSAATTTAEPTARLAARPMSTPVDPRAVVLPGPRAERRHHRHRRSFRDRRHRTAAIPDRATPCLRLARTEVAAGETAITSGGCCASRRAATGVRRARRCPRRAGSAPGAGHRAPPPGP